MSDNGASLMTENLITPVSLSLVLLAPCDRLNKTMKEGLPLVSMEQVEWMAENDNATGTLKDVATQWLNQRVAQGKDRSFQMGSPFSQERC